MEYVFNAGEFQDDIFGYLLKKNLRLENCKLLKCVLKNEEIQKEISSYLLAIKSTPKDTNLIGVHGFCFLIEEYKSRISEGAEEVASKVVDQKMKEVDLLLLRKEIAD